MVKIFNISLDNSQKGNLISFHWTLQAFNLFGIDGEVSVEGNSLIAEVVVSEEQLSRLLRIFEIRKTNYEIISRS